MLQSALSTHQPRRVAVRKRVVTMGAHESNAGLCGALLRAYITFRCSEEQRRGDKNGGECAKILERLAARGCTTKSVVNGEEAKNS